MLLILKYNLDLSRHASMSSLVKFRRLIGNFLYVIKQTPPTFLTLKEEEDVHNCWVFEQGTCESGDKYFRGSEKHKTKVLLTDVSKHNN